MKVSPCEYFSIFLNIVINCYYDIFVKNVIKKFETVLLGKKKANELYSLNIIL